MRFFSDFSYSVSLFLPILFFILSYSRFNFFPFSLSVNSASVEQFKIECDKVIDTLI